MHAQCAWLSLLYKADLYWAQDQNGGKGWGRGGAWSHTLVREVSLFAGLRNCVVTPAQLNAFHFGPLHRPAQTGKFRVI